MPPPVPTAPETKSWTARDIQGTQDGWLKILKASDLLATVHASKAVDAMWRQSKVALPVWERDLLAALHRYAEFVQLVPASESHHHAHAGGLLSHTLEMLLAAMTWRNGHFLPENAQVEVMDAERDEWTYVVFYAALLHDIAKPMTDLRILWRSAGMADPIPWRPISGSLLQTTQDRPGGEYLVDFTPKALRDYGAHGRLAITLLHQIASPTALTFMARRPHTLVALTQYLSGQDSTSLVAQIVQRADKASTQRALLQGSKARFATSSSVPLIELLMTAMRSMLKNGTVLPLNRSGAAGWVFDGSVWFVAKRLADAVRAHVKQHAPDESMPGETKNDRLFDTWQEYGCIQLNPHSGQAVWYVVVQGAAEEGGAGYEHALTMLRFPLNKVFDGSQEQPGAMRGRIVVKDKRVADDAVDRRDPEAEASEFEPVLASPTPDKFVAESGPKDAKNTVATHAAFALDAPKVEATYAATTDPARPRGNPNAPAPLKAPAFNKPKPVTTPVAVTATARNPAATVPETALNTAANSAISSALAPTSVEATTSVTAPVTVPVRNPSAGPIAPPFGRFNEDMLGGFSFEDFLPDEDDAKHAAKDSDSKPMPKPATAPHIQNVQPIPTKSRATAASGTKLQQPKAVGIPIEQEAVAIATPATAMLSVEPPSLPAPKPISRPLIERPSTTARSGRAASSPEPEATSTRQIDSANKPKAKADTVPVPVVLMPQMPALPGLAAGIPVEPTEGALAFMRWVQEGLAQRRIKYNETGATVHFTTEGMALVSPVIFKHYAREIGDPADAEARAIQVQREVIKAAWHMVGPNKVNILQYQVIGRAGSSVSKLSAVVLLCPDRWVVPVPPSNPVLKLA